MKRFAFFFLLTLLCAELLQAQPGSLDPSFSDDGILVISSAGRDEAKAVAVQPDGKILVAGFINGTSTINTYDMVVYRFNEDGTYDNTFDGDGKLIINPGRNDGVDAMLIQPDGRILLAGYTGDASNCLGKCYVRLNTDGSLDNTFGTGGWVAYDYGVCSPTVQVMRGLDIDASGNIYSGGYINSGASGPALWLYKIKQDGSLDNSFDGDGAIYMAGELTNCVSLNNNKLLLNLGDINKGVLRLNADGTLDNTFDSDGYLLFSSFMCNNLYVNDQNKILIIGTSLLPNNEGKGIDLFKINDDGSLDNSFGNNGMVHHSIFVDNVPPNQYNFLATSSRIYSVGNSTCPTCSDMCSNTLVPSPCINESSDGSRDFVIVAFNSSDGSLVNDFASNGIKVISVVSGNKDEAYGAALDASGNIIMAGFTESGGAPVNRDIAIIRVLGSSVTDVNTATDKSFFQLYPNPGNGKYTLAIPSGKRIKSLRLKNILGEQFEIKTDQMDESVLIDLSTLPDLLYFLEVKEESGASETIKIIKK